MQWHGRRLGIISDVTQFSATFTKPHDKSLHQVAARAPLLTQVNALAKGDGEDAVLPPL